MPKLQQSRYDYVPAEKHPGIVFCVEVYEYDDYLGHIGKNTNGKWGANIHYPIMYGDCFLNSEHEALKVLRNGK